MFIVVDGGRGQRWVLIGVRRTCLGSDIGCQVSSS